MGDLARLYKEFNELKNEVAKLRMQNGPRILRPAAGGGGGDWWVEAESVVELGVPSSPKVGFIESGDDAGEYWFPPWGLVNADWIRVNRYV